MSLPTILLIAAAISLGAMVITIIIAFRSSREAESAIFPIVREEEILRAQRARIYIFLWAAVAALFLGGWLASLRLVDESALLVAGSQESAPLSEADQVAPREDEPVIAQVISPTSAAPTATPTEIPPVNNPAVAPEPSPTALPPTDSPQPPDTPIPPTAIPTDTPVLSTATATNTAEPTTTPASTNASGAPAAPVAAIQAPAAPAPADARMGPIEFGTGVTNNTQVQNPGKLFPADTEEIYAVFPFSGMENGLDYKIIWYQDGTELWRDEGIWEWGDQAKLFSFFKFPGPGSFKVEVQVNDSVLTSGLFEVQ